MEIRLCTEPLSTAREQVSTSWLALKRGEKSTVRHACGILVWNPERLKSTTDRCPKNKVKSQWRRLDLIARLSGHRNTIHAAGSQLAAMTHHCQRLSQHALCGGVLCSLPLRGIPRWGVYVRVCENCCHVFHWACYTQTAVCRSWRRSVSASGGRITSGPTTTSVRPHRCEDVFLCLFC